MTEEKERDFDDFLTNKRRKNQENEEDQRGEGNNAQ